MNFLQYDARLGIIIIKVDLLGLGMMAVLEDCLELIRKHYGKPVDLAQLPPDDPPVYETLRRADTVGMFQVESRAQMASLRAMLRSIARTRTRTDAGRAAVSGTTAGKDESADCVRLHGNRC